MNTCLCVSGALFPTPILGVLMIYELGDPPRTYMESIILLSFGACISFLIYYSLMEYTYLEKLDTSNRVSNKHTCTISISGIYRGLVFILPAGYYIRNYCVLPYCVIIVG